MIFEQIKIKKSNFGFLLSHILFCDPKIKNLSMQLLILQIESIDQYILSSNALMRNMIMISLKSFL